MQNENLSQSDYYTFNQLYVFTSHSDNLYEYNFGIIISSWRTLIEIENGQLFKNSVINNTCNYVGL